MRLKISAGGNGNLFGVETFIKGKTILLFILTIIFPAIVGVIVGEKSPLSLISFKAYIIGFVVGCLLFFIKNYKIIAAISKEYLNLKSFMSVYFIITLVLAASIFFLEGSRLLLTSLFVLWIVSGFLRTYLHKSKALFNLDLNKMLLLCKAFAFSRISFYFLGLSTLPSWEIIIKYFPYNSFSLILLIIISYINVKYNILPLYPYLMKSDKIKESLKIIRFIGRNSKASFENIRQDINKSKEYLQEKLTILIKLNYIIKRGRFYYLREEYLNLL